MSKSSTTANPPTVKKTAFVHKLYSMLQDSSLSHLIWWTRDKEEGTFALYPGSEFATALTGYFKHGNVASFVRQLHMYGFHKVSDPQNTTNGPNNTQPVWEFKHSSGKFRKDDEASLVYIKRRSSSNSNKNGLGDDTNVNGTSSASSPAAEDHQYFQPTPLYYQQHNLVPHPQYNQQTSYATVQYFHSYPSTPLPTLVAHQASQSAGQPSQYSQAQYTHSVLLPTVDISRELSQSQQALMQQAEMLSKDLKRTSQDVLRFADHLPKLEPVLVKIENPDIHKIGEIKKSFNLRANSLVDPLSNGNSPQGSISGQTAYGSPQQLQPLHFQPSFNQQPFKNKLTEVKFWDSNSTSRPRNPSVLVDPLAPVPHAVHSAAPSSHQEIHNSFPISRPDSIASETSSKHNSLSTISAYPPSTSSSGHLKRSSSHVLQSTPSSSATLTQLAYTQSATQPPKLLPRDIISPKPIHNYNQDLPHHSSSISDRSINGPTSNPSSSDRSSVSDSRMNSLPHIGQLHEQIRPSLIELHGGQANQQPEPSSSIVSTHSTNHSNSLFSNKSSISSIGSISGRPSFGSFSHLLNESSNTTQKTPTSNMNGIQPYQPQYQALNFDQRLNSPKASSPSQPQFYQPQRRLTESPGIKATTSKLSVTSLLDDEVKTRSDLNGLEENESKKQKLEG